MFKFYQNWSRIKKKIFLVFVGILSIPIGGFLGFFLGLVTTTFIPICCENGGCHSCFEFNGMVGHEATGFIGFWVGLFLLPLIYISLIIYLKRKNKI